MSHKSNKINDFLPISPLDFQVLLLLQHEPRHGYGIVHAGEELFPSEPPLEIGSLYRIVGRMLDSGLIREVDPPPESPRDARRRRFYQTTELGVAVARAEAARMHALLESPQATELLHG
ncbi:MAG: helix-turn-helix transcriptional regulator [Gemmatimonadota bacterium]|nr:MAG: helix-turn-helix transcriptional regulator [Gemmatimonadota bacterium]